MMGKWIWEKGVLLASVKCNLQQAVGSELANRAPNEDGSGRGL